MKRLAFLNPYFKRYRRALAGGLAASLAGSLLGLVAPILLGRAVDSLETALSARTLLFYAGLLLGVALLRGLFVYGQRMILVPMSRNIERDLLVRYFKHLEQQPLSFFQARKTGDLMARATNDLGAVRMVCGPAIMYAANTLFTGVGALVFMLRLDPLLALAALAPMPFVALVTRFFGSRIHKLFTAVQERFAALSSRVQEHLAGLRVVRAYAREGYEEEGFERANQASYEANRQLIRWNAAFMPALEGMIGVGYVIVLAYGGALVGQGRLTLGELVAFNFFLGRLVWPMIAIGWVMNLVERASASLKRLEEIFSTEPSIADLPGSETFAGHRIRGDVLFRKLTFSYDGTTPVLRHIDLAVSAGTTVAVAGRTGSGKSTLLSLIPRLIDPPAASLAVDGLDVRSLPLATLRGAIAVVPQETFLFSDTVAANIAFGKPEASREEIAQAARDAGLEEDLAGFPQGLDTVVGERGITLSGGQKQRVALARAILPRPKILLLDDCLSAVDTQTEERILANLKRVAAGRTVFLVSHRVSTLKGADQIVVLADGEVVERGTHGQLVAAGGFYADLERRQQLEEELARV